MNLINKIILTILVTATLFIFAYFPFQYKQFISDKYVKIEQHTDTISINKINYLVYKLYSGNYLLNIDQTECDKNQILKDVLFQTYIQKDDIEIKNITIRSVIQKKESTQNTAQLTNDDEYIKLKYLNIYNESKIDSLKIFIRDLKKELLK
jgi:hypothetical protein